MFITVIQKKADEFIISRFQARRGALQFVRGARHRLTEDDVSSADILASWRAECQGDRIVLALPPTLISLRELELSVTDRKKCREIIPLELKGETATDSDEPVYEALPLAQGRIAAIWAKESLLAEEIKLLSAHGFDPEAITCSMFNWQELLPGECEGAVALTDGESVAVYSGRQAMFFRALPISGENPLAATIAAVEFAKDIRVEKVFSLGNSFTGAVELPHGGSLANAFPGDVAAAADLAAHYAMARELAFGEPVNLRRGALRFTKASDNLKKKLRITGVLAAALVLLVIAEAGVRYYILQRDISSLNTSIRAIYKDVFPARTKAVDEVSELKAEIKRLGATGSEGVLAVLKKLTEAKGDDPREIYEIDFDGLQVTGRGYDRSAGGVNEFKAKASLQFGNFEVSEIKSRPDGSVSFAFRGNLKGGGK